MENDINSIKEDVLDGLRRPMQISKLVSYILKSKEADGTADENGQPKVMSTQEILNVYKELREQNEDIILIPQNSISTILSFLSKNENYPIFCQGRKQGYFFKELPINDEEECQTEKVSNSSDDNKDESFPKEREIYPYLVSWLQAKGFDIAQDISSNKMKGSWRNPDILGIRTTDVFKTTYIEIVTIEAKLSKDYWSKNIFEAVAHTVFANRSYFAYLSKESEKIDEEMISYAQKFNIGILRVIVPDNMWEKSLSECGPDDIDIQEIFPAPEQTPFITFQKQFLKKLEINDFDDYKRLFNGNKQTNN